ncbi:hypothetical protein MLD38_020676 [Melastoma candidum]|uniref:Uncharacterized protein n=1 Tax=Melastoma candidum TaxID=119954 RepID=A0ACB9QEM0_9MYRT|nr:hypothetical protein MLD38_020676 [Melastoma candidum]
MLGCGAQDRLSIKGEAVSSRCQQGRGTDVMIERVIRAHECERRLPSCKSFSTILYLLRRTEIIESECLNLFDNPEREALDVFVSELLCIGKGRELQRILARTIDTSAEADLLCSLIIKGKFENNRNTRPRTQPASSTKHVDWD